MPTSYLPTWVKTLWLIESIVPPPRSLLDVGPGGGKAAVLCREMLNSPPARIDAVEVHSPYVAKFRLAALYDTVFHLDVLEVPTETLARYDCVLMGDVVEHLPDAAVFPLLDRAAGWVVICTPLVYHDNGPGLPDSETHRSWWPPERWKDHPRLDVLDHDVAMGAVWVRLRPRVAP